MTITNTAIVPNTEDERCLYVVADEENETTRILDLHECGESLLSLRINGMDLDTGEYNEMIAALRALDTLPTPVLQAFGLAINNAFKNGYQRGENRGADEVRRGLHKLLGTDRLERDMASIAESLGTLAYHANERR